ncbi:acyl-CoA thioesterase [Sphingomonas sp. AP4-R1]|uniref:acyl-CoA thioesterase n=1 Tax=Sphingomonas sp. AP4-R1 TaxID=2735134 RepID=UPI001493BADB|nr:acyl-CoA thioesterase [Sphingomonas sp. AP4-R1]QJU60441.1 acyl-CoA thioesterase [Sphingomonas sp. AP4-R1]
MPADTNPYGDIFGGWLLSQMDSAAGTVAALHSQGRAVTIALDGMTFHKPVKVGDVISVYAEVVAQGRSSMKIDVSAWARKRASEDTYRVTHATFTFVAIDNDGRPRPLAD